MIVEVKAGANQRQLPGAANSLKTQSVNSWVPYRPQLEERTLEGSSLTLVTWAREGVQGRGGGKVGWEPYTWLLHYEDWDRGIVYQGLC